MKYGLDVPTTGEYADPRVLAPLASEAEAAGWDGVCLKSYHQDRREPLTPADVSEALAYVRERRSAGTPFDVAVSGESPADISTAREQTQPFSDAGATWWIEEGLGWTLDEFRARILAGPPRG